MTADYYIRDTKDMLTDGVALPSVYGASEPDMNAADLRTTGYELSIGWRDQFNLFGKSGAFEAFKDEVFEFVVDLEGVEVASIRHGRCEADG